MSPYLTQPTRSLVEYATECFEDAYSALCQASVAPNENAVREHICRFLWLSKRGEDAAALAARQLAPVLH